MSLWAGALPLAGHGGDGDAVHRSSAHAADPFPAVVIEGDRVAVVAGPGGATSPARHELARWAAGTVS